jgi:hypothetical protein
MEMLFIQSGSLAILRVAAVQFWNITVQEWTPKNRLSEIPAE